MPIMKGFLKVTDPNLYKILAIVINRKFMQPVDYVESVLVDNLKPFIDLMVDTTSLYIETDYVDKLYRDSYYRYYSSKATIYSRDCIRLSFFDNKDDTLSSDIIKYSQADEVRKKYQGYIILRPTFPQIIGRNALSPQLYKQHDFAICTASIASTVDGFKVSVNAFPSASQDTESITCAETTLWALMEYYGNKYIEYSPIKLSEILESLKASVNSRQLPSNGLNADNLTSALKSFGFGPQLYHISAFSQLHNILSCYVESGIPIVVAISNRVAIINKVKDVTDRINHAILCVGHEKVTDAIIDASVGKTTTLKNKGGDITVLDFDDIEKQFVFIDDNQPPYGLDSLSSPAYRYGKPNWQHCTIECIIAPLYKKIYMEPFIAKKYTRTLLQTDYYSHLCNSNITMRTFLCSTRSYRDYVNTSNMSDSMKDVISSLYMPKFIWVSEISDTDGLKQGLVRNIILIDATGLQTSYFEPLLVAFTDTKYYKTDRHTNQLKVGSITYQKFNSFNNLK